MGAFPLGKFEKNFGTKNFLAILSTVMAWRCLGLCVVGLVLADGPLVADPLGTEKCLACPCRAAEMAEKCPVLCHVQMASPKQLGGEVMALAEDVMRENCLAPKVLLGLVGYPDFPGISEKDFCHAFLVDHGAGAGWILCVRASGSSPVISAAALHGMKAAPWGGWVFLAKDEKLLGREDLLDGLVPMAGLPCAHDVCINCCPALIRRLAILLERSTLRNLQFLQDLNGSMSTLALLNLVLNLGDSLERVLVFCDVTEKGLAWQATFCATPGSDLATLFNESLDGMDMDPLARLIPADCTAQMLARYNPRRLEQFWEYFLDGFFSYGQQGLNGVAERDVYNQLHGLLGTLNGVAATGRGQDGCLRKLLTANISYEKLADGVSFFYTKVVPTLRTSLATLPQDVSLRVEANVERQSFVHRGVPVIHVCLAECRTTADGEEDCSYRNSYFCTLRDLVAIASCETTMRTTIDDILRGQLRQASLSDINAIDIGRDVAVCLRITPPLCDSSACCFLRLGNGQFTVDCAIGRSALRSLLAPFCAASHP